MIILNSVKKLIVYDISTPKKFIKINELLLPKKHRNDSGLKLNLNIIDGRTTQNLIVANLVYSLQNVENI